MTGSTEAAPGAARVTFVDDDPSALPPGALLAGKFRVVRCLGMGGMGAVYEIEHELTKHRRALKLLHAVMAQNAGVVERFLREASAAGRVGNPHIIETFDAGTLDTGEPYLVMEILRGDTLSALIERGPMPVAEVVDLIGQACDGVQAAHDAGIVHRDLKPDNLFVVELDGRPFVKLLDFGISKFDPGKTGGLALTQEGAALGTPYYMSPEQIRGETSLDARADVYALGVILYECLAGCRPFLAEALTQLAVLIHIGRPTPLQELRPDLPPGLADVVARAMATDPAHRFPAARDLRAALERYGHIAGVQSRYAAGGGARSVAVTGSVAAKSMPPKAMATSAAGVSVRGAAGVQKKAGAGVIAAGFGALALLLGGAFLLFRQTTAATAEPSASSPTQAAAAAPWSGTRSTASPEALQPASATPSALPPAPSASSRTASPGRMPVVAPTLQGREVTAVSAVSTPASPRPSAAPAPTLPKPGRAEQKGLAQDNPYR